MQNDEDELTPPTAKKSRATKYVFSLFRRSLSTPRACLASLSTYIRATTVSVRCPASRLSRGLTLPQEKVSNASIDSYLSLVSDHSVRTELATTQHAASLHAEILHPGALGKGQGKESCCEYVRQCYAA